MNCLTLFLVYFCESFQFCAIPWLVQVEPTCFGWMENCTKRKIVELAGHVKRDFAVVCSRFDTVKFH